MRTWAEQKRDWQWFGISAWVWGSGVGSLLGLAFAMGAWRTGQIHLATAEVFGFTGAVLGVIIVAAGITIEWLTDPFFRWVTGWARRRGYLGMATMWGIFGLACGAAFTGLKWPTITEPFSFKWLGLTEWGYLLTGGGVAFGIGLEWVLRRHGREAGREIPAKSYAKEKAEGAGFFSQLDSGLKNTWKSTEPARGVLDGLMALSIGGAVAGGCGYLLYRFWPQHPFPGFDATFASHRDAWIDWSVDWFFRVLPLIYFCKGLTLALSGLRGIITALGDRRPTLASEKGHGAGRKATLPEAKAKLSGDHPRPPWADHQFQD